ncbi:hypothetical protein NMY22_g10915 [Coprinellus aureogranulatus]|nr:hypothetical protein NMY22_g10915 [Coprinellus aureogranulatus]
MRVPLSLFLFAWFGASAFAHSFEEDLATRNADNAILDTREFLEDIGVHARALHDSALSVRRLEDVEARLAALEDELDIRKEGRGWSGEEYVCYICGKKFVRRDAFDKHTVLVHKFISKEHKRTPGV